MNKYAKETNKRKKKPELQLKSWLCGRTFVKCYK